MFSSNKNSRKGLLRQRPACPAGRRGQNITEYLILVAGVLVVVILAVSKGGFFTKGVEKSINMMFDSVEDMATVQCLGTIDDVNGQWSGWSSWGPCTSCTQIRTRTCTNPAPKCGGSACTLTDGSKGLLETEAQACYSGSWLVGACGVCTGACGSTAGTCTQAVTCNGGCCDPSSQPASVIFCTKAPYPDVWSALGFGSCSVSCDAGISSQTVTCSGMCCDAATKPPTRRACADGCCAQDLYIGRDIVNNVDFTGTFGPAANGASVTLTCPSGYGGTPTRTCTATASGSCTGNDTYSPPNSCYNILWGGLSGECQPANCIPWTTDIGMGVNGTFPNTLHGDTAYADCAAFDARYQGTSTADCWLGAWQNLAQGCRPADCTASWTTDIGSGVMGTFPPTTHGTTESLSCSAIDSRYQGTSTAACDYGSWINLVQGCQPASCVDEIFMDPNSFVAGTFPASPHGTPQTLDCAAIDNRYTGVFSRTCDYGRWINSTGGCTAASCPAWTTNVGGVNITFTAVAHGVTQPQNCAMFDSTYTGTVNATCDYGNWINLTGGCTPNCPTQTLDVGSGQTGSFTTITSGQTRYSTCPNGYSGTPNRFCSSGTWGPLNNGCTPNACVDEYLDIGAGQSGWFYAGPSGTTRTQSCPNGYSGSPTRTCTAGNWGSLSNACVCVPTCPAGSCGIVNNATTCWTNRDCGPCCGNGALNGTEQCDGSSYNTGLFWLGIVSCNQWRAQNFQGGTISCNADCTVNTSQCCTAVNGTWGAWSACSSCQQTRTCNGASCGGSCSGSSTQPCYSGTWSTGSWGACSVPCGGGTQTRTVTCSSSCCDPGTQPVASQSCNTQACPQCTGAPPDPNSTMCSGDSTGLNADTPSDLVSACGAAKCEFTCNAGYSFVPTRWVYISWYTPTGTWLNPTCLTYSTCSPAFPDNVACSSPYSRCNSLWNVFGVRRCYVYECTP